MDEIGELSPMVQTKLLRVIESKEVQRIGSPKRLAVNFRLIAATNRDLESMAREGKFRLDLWYRLSAYVISIPPLRERLLDIPYLVSYHAGRLAEDLELAFMPRIGDTMMASLMHREWPGNIRELRNWLERALIHSRSAGSMVLIEPISAVLPVDRTGKSPSHFNELATLDEIEKQYIIHVLDICAWKVQGDGGAAEILGLKPNTLRSRMKKLGIPFMKKSLAMQFNHVRTQFD